MQSHGTRPSDRTKRQSQMNAGGARSAALGGRDGGVADGLEYFVQRGDVNRHFTEDNEIHYVEYFEGSVDAEVPENTFIPPVVPPVRGLQLQEVLEEVKWVLDRNGKVVLAAPHPAVGPPPRH